MRSQRKTEHFVFPPSALGTGFAFKRFGRMCGNAFLGKQTYAELCVAVATIQTKNEAYRGTFGNFDPAKFAVRRTPAPIILPCCKA